MTDPTGKAFVSYKRTRLHEIKLLVQALHDHGIPTWQDITDLDAEPTPEELRRVIQDPQTAAALLWLTAEVKDSPAITKIEIPEILNRKRKGGSFFVQPIAAGALNYDEAAAAVGEHAGIDDLQRWNITRVQSDPIDEGEAARIAERVLHRRLREVHRSLSPDAPIRLNLQTREKAPFVPGTALSLDWAGRFDGRIAEAGTWSNRLLPALRTVSTVMREVAHGRRVEAGGLCTLSAATALGAAFLAPTGTEIGWRQRNPLRDDQIWSLKADRETAEISIRCSESDISSEDLAVIVTIGHDVETPIGKTQDTLPKFRGYVHVTGPGEEPMDLRTPGQAVDAVRRTIDAVNTARKQWRGIRQVHFFLATPTGFAVMLGQLINGMGPVSTYEHDPIDAIGIYRRAAILHPGA